MSYTAIVAEVAAIQPIKGADRIVLATVAGHSVVVGRDTAVGDIGILFPPDGQLSHEMAHHNNLYRVGKGENKDPSKNGYLGGSRRIRTLKMKGVASEGLFVGLDAVAWAGDSTKLTPGLQFTHLGGKEICSKYYSPATKERIKTANNRGKKTPHQVALQRHYDTPQFRYNYQNIPEATRIVFTEKLHGTSGRTGRVLCSASLSWFQTQWNRVAGWFGLPTYPAEQYEYVSGTRRVNLSLEFSNDTGYYSGTRFRKIIHDEIVRRGLYKGETLYYEIVGFDEKGRPIMPPHTLDPKAQKDLITMYGSDRVLYRYGCQDHLGCEETPEGEKQFLAGKDVTDQELSKAFGVMFKVFVYRITMQNEDGDTVDLPWELVKKRCAELALNHVPELIEPRFCIGDSDAVGLNGVLNGMDPTDIWGLNHETLRLLCQKLSQGPSTLDPTHIREGVCALVESGGMWKALKYKGWDFAHCEGIRKNDDRYVDPEEVA